MYEFLWTGFTGLVLNKIIILFIFFRARETFVNLQPDLQGT